MKAPDCTHSDRRGGLPGLDSIARWFELPSAFKVGLRHVGEFKMGADTGNVIIADKDRAEWINVGQYSFYFPDWNAGGIEPDAWNNPVTFSPDGTYLVLNWLYAHRHGAMSPVLVHLPSRTFSLVEPRRILTVKGVTVTDHGPELSCHELVWKNSQREDHHDVRIVPQGPLRPLTEFFELDPFTIDADVYSWKEGILHLEPLKNFRNIVPLSEKEREEIKRDRCYSPVARWRHMQEISDWVKHQIKK